MQTPGWNSSSWRIKTRMLKPWIKQESVLARQAPALPFSNGKLILLKYSTGIHLFSDIILEADSLLTLNPRGLPHHTTGSWKPGSTHTAACSSVFAGDSSQTGLASKASLQINLDSASFFSCSYGDMGILKTGVSPTGCLLCLVFPKIRGRLQGQPLKTNKQTDRWWP